MKNSWFADLDMKGIKAGSAQVRQVWLAAFDRRHRLTSIFHVCQAPHIAPTTDAGGGELTLDAPYTESFSGTDTAWYDGF